MHETSLDLSGYAALVGKDLPQPEQFNYEVTRDTIRHFAYCIPDSNALYLDDQYAATTRWRGIIAPPGYLYAHGSPAWLGKMPGIRDASGNEMEGNDNATEAWEFFRPVRPGDTVLSYGKIAGIEPKKSRKLGDAVLVNEEMRFTNQRGEMVARLNSFTFRFDDKRVAEAGTIAQTYPPLEPGQFTRNVATLPALPGTFPTPIRRYDAARFFEDIAEKPHKVDRMLTQMASGGHKERLACAETVLFTFAIRERKPAVYIVLKNCHAVGMRMHHRLLVCSVVDSEHAHLLIFDFNLVMFRVHSDGVLNCLLGVRSCRHDFLL